MTDNLHSLINGLQGLRNYTLNGTSSDEEKSTDGANTHQSDEIEINPMEDYINDVKFYTDLIEERGIPHDEAQRRADVLVRKAMGDD